MASRNGIEKGTLNWSIRKKREIMVDINKNTEAQLEPSKLSDISFTHATEYEIQNAFLSNINSSYFNCSADSANSATNDGSSCVSTQNKLKISDFLLSVDNSYKKQNYLFKNSNEFSDKFYSLDLNNATQNDWDFYYAVLRKLKDLDKFREIRNSQISRLKTNFLGENSRFSNKKIDDLTKIDEQYRKYAHAYLDMIAKGDNMNIIICGNRGIGKTSLACAIVNEIIEKKLIKSEFVNLGNYLSACMKCNDFSNDLEHPLKSILNAQIIVIDDFGHMRNTAYGIEQIFTLVDELYKLNKTLIVTTNLAENQLKNNNGEFSAIISRLLENSILMSMKGEDIRKSKVFTPEQIFG